MIDAVIFMKSCIAFLDTFILFWSILKKYIISADNSLLALKKTNTVEEVEPFA